MPAIDTEIPDWVTETPDKSLEHDQWVWYMLAMTNTQSIEDLTREEFIALKAHLAAMRGYTERSAA